MERESNSVRSLCKGGCGFFGSSATDGFCSLCFKDNLRKNQSTAASGTCPNPAQQSSVAAARQPTLRYSSSKESNAAVKDESAKSSISTASSDDKDKDSKKKKNRCDACRKKVGLTGFACRCAGLFCPLHRYSDKHDCTFDYKAMGAEEIRHRNPLVVGEKVQKI